MAKRDVNVQRQHEHSGYEGATDHGEVSGLGRRQDYTSDGHRRFKSLRTEIIRSKIGCRQRRRIYPTSGAPQYYLLRVHYFLKNFYDHTATRIYYL